MSKTITEALREKGHTSEGGVCQKCWDEAWRRSVEDTSLTHAEHYYRVLKEAEATDAD